MNAGTNPVPDLIRTQVHIRILATTDLHVHLLPYDYLSDRPAPALGLSRIAQLVTKIRATTPNCLLFDNGDFLVGSPLADAIAGGPEIATDHPAIRAMNRLAYDAACIGNHEFNLGLEYLTRSINAARFPVLSSNVYRRGDGGPSPVFARSALLERSFQASDQTRVDLRIGVLGLTPPQITSWDKHRLPDWVQVEDMVQAARQTVPELRAAGADVVVALCHSGLGEAEHTLGMENAIIPLAEIDGIDVLVAGHTHSVFPDPELGRSDHVDPVRGLVHNKPVVLAGSYGSHLGVIDLCLERENTGWRQAAAPMVTALEVGNDTRDEHGDAGISEAIRPDHERTLYHIRRPIGETVAPLQSYFARVAADPTLWLIAEAQRRHFADLLDRPEFRDLPHAVAVSPFRAGGHLGPQNYVDIPAGPLLLRNAAELYPHPDTCVAMILRGSEVRRWLEHAGSTFGRLDTDGVARLHNPNRPGYFFDQLDGLRYAFDLSGPSPVVTDLRSPLGPIQDDDRVVLITNSYRAGGGGGYHMAASAEIIEESRATACDMIIDAIRAVPVIRPVVRQNWRFADRHAGQWVTFDTGPGALSYLRDFTGGGLQHTGHTDRGFATFRFQI